MKKFFRYLSLVFFAGILTFFALNEYERFLDRRLGEVPIDSMLKNGGPGVKTKGAYILQRSLDEGDFQLIGSSELSAHVPQNPKNMYPNKDLPCRVNIVGSAYAQSLIDAVRYGGLHLKKGDKLAIIVSYQWFFGRDIDIKGTQRQFSELQLYRFMVDKDICAEDKKYVCNRFAKLLADEPSLRWAYIYARLQAADSWKGILGKALLSPLFSTRFYLLNLKDKHDSYYHGIKGLMPENKTIKEYDWENEQRKAEKEGQAACTNNKLYVNDEYYDKYIRKRYETYKEPTWRRVLKACLETNKSKEFNDYRLLLRILCEKGVRPYIIFMSTNGFYYDLAGKDMRERRLQFYDKLAAITQEAGIEYLDLRDYEYTPYFYCDVMHMGWKGWAYVNEQCSKHFAKNAK